jgi:hypothetical protein
LNLFSSAIEIATHQVAPNRGIETATWPRAVTTTDGAREFKMTRSAAALGGPGTLELLSPQVMGLGHWQRETQTNRSPLY